MQAFRSTGTLGSGESDEWLHPPEANFDFWLEWWLPAGYFGGPKEIALEWSRYFVGTRAAKSILNVIDYPRNAGEPTAANRSAAPLPRLPDTNSSEIYAFWANQLLRNNQGIDFAGNPSSTNDHDQQLAEAFHDPYARADPFVQGTNYWGTAKTPNNLDSGQYFHYASPLAITELEKESFAGGRMATRQDAGASLPLG